MDQDTPKEEPSAGKYLARLPGPKTLVKTPSLPAEFGFSVPATLEKWPSFFPPFCPPPDAREENLEAFRLLDGNVPSDKDFESHVVAGKSFDPAHCCDACGVSVFKSIDDVKNLRRRFRPLRNKFIARIRISDEDGVVKQTGATKSHHTWWVTHADPKQCFVALVTE